MRCGVSARETDLSRSAQNDLPADRVNVWCDSSLRFTMVVPGEGETDVVYKQACNISPLDLLSLS